MNTTFYVYDNMNLKEISILNLFEQIKENTIIRLGFFGSTQQLGRGFHTRPSVRHGQPTVKILPVNECIHVFPNLGHSGKQVPHGS